MPEFVSDTILKRDLLSEIHRGHMKDRPDRIVIRRVVTRTPWWTRPLARLLARREYACLEAVSRELGRVAPAPLGRDAHGHYRSWVEGEPLDLARPGDPFWYRDAFRLLRILRRRGVTHNDLAKPQNWLMLPDGSAGLIDFQLAWRHRRRGPLYRFMAYEDFRHLLKQMHRYAPEMMTPTARRVYGRRSLPNRIWRSSGKRVYNAITRKLLHWADREGKGIGHDRTPL
jgi:RIO-like serine/threonine protein kinase